jgi:hypothetical protein
MTTSITSDVLPPHSATEPDTPPPGSTAPTALRPRFSLLTMLLIVTITGLALVVVLLWGEVGPLREEVRRYRAEAGFLTIDDPSRLSGIQVRTKEDGWKWRVYFPPGVNYKVYAYSGMIPAGVDAVQRNDLTSMNPGPGALSYTFGGPFEGETIIEARLVENVGKWTMEVSFDGMGWSNLRLDESFAEFLSNPRGAAFWSSNLNANSQTTFPTRERVFLLKRRKPKITQAPGGGTLSGEAAGPAPGVALWIQPVK